MPLERFAVQHGTFDDRHAALEQIVGHLHHLRHRHANDGAIDLLEFTDMRHGRNPVERRTAPFRDALGAPHESRDLDLRVVRGDPRTRLAQHSESDNSEAKPFHVGHPRAGPAPFIVHLIQANFPPNARPWVDPGQFRDRRHGDKRRETG
jgi:hypothetical protein